MISVHQGKGTFVPEEVEKGRHMFLIKGVGRA